MEIKMRSILVSASEGMEAHERVSRHKAGCGRVWELAESWRCSFSSVCLLSLSDTCACMITSCTCAAREPPLLRWRPRTQQPSPLSAHSRCSTQGLG